MRNKLNIAILSPQKNVYSETFIRAHRNKIDGNIFYYYGGHVPVFLEVNNKDNKIKNLRNSFLKNKIDVVLAEYGVTAAESLLAIKKAGIPLVVHFHGFDAYNNDVIKKYENNYKEVFKYASSVIVVSLDMKKKIIDLGCPENKIIYTVCAPNEEFFEVSPEFQTQQFLAIGRFVDKKAPYYTILAFKEISGQYPGAQLKMAANGPLLPICKNLVRYLKLEHRVDFIGVVSRARIKVEMENSLAFVQHSIIAENGDSEGTPVSVMEAGAARLPVIATNHAGIADVVEDGETGILIDEHNVSAMAKAMKKLIDNPVFAKRLGDNAREKVRKEFSMDKHISIIENQLFNSAVPISKKAYKITFQFCGFDELKNKISFLFFAPDKFFKKYFSRFFRE